MNRKEALLLLEHLGAPSHLLRHAHLVQETATQILDALAQRFPEAVAGLDRDLVEAGAILHDVGKTLHPEELHRPGHAHEEAGKAWLLEHGVSADLAAICVSHAQWATLTCSREELLVALADKLWKGRREQELEEALTRQLAGHAGKDFWEVYPALLDVCERIAARGDERLLQSVRHDM